MHLSVMTRAIAAIALLLLTGSAHAACFDLRDAEPAYLEGHLSFRIFAGPPGFQDVQKGDTPEPGYVLALRAPICIEGDDDFADPDYLFDEVQLVPTEETDAAMRALDDTDVAVDLRDPMPAMTGHHHRPLLAWVTAIRPLTAAPEEIGSASAVVEAFYLALGQGAGALAAQFVVPEKTVKGPFSPDAMTRFYGGLAEPLRLLSVEQTGPDRFRVHYRFRGAGGTCDGRATVSTVTRDGRHFIQSIKAENGC